MTATLEQKSPYRVVHDGLLRLHELFLQGEESSAEARAIRDEMDEPWLELQDEEQERLFGLSKDLNDVKDIKTEPVDREATPEENNVFLRAVGALQNGHFDVSLKLLRDNKATPPFSRVSFLRARNWEGMHEPKTALVFYNHAASLDPNNEYYQASALGALHDAFPDEGNELVEKVLMECEKYPASVIIRACEIVFHKTLRSGDEKEHRFIYEQIVKALHHALEEMQSGSEQKKISECQPIYGVVCSLLATCCRHLGMMDPAFHYYTTAIGLDPLNAALLAARGSVLYGHDPFSTQYAIQDFQRAMLVGSDLAIPYYFVAHFLLHTYKLDECLQAIEKGLTKQGTKRLKSELLEFRAIALAALNKPEGVVTGTFKEAIKVDDTNKRALSNLQVYESMLKRKSTPTSETWILNIDTYTLTKEIPSPRTLRETVDNQFQLVG